MQADSVAVDNDVIIKLIRYGISDRLHELCGNEPDAIHILGLARFVVRRRLARSGSSRPVSDLEAELEQLRRGVLEIEPTEEEITLATSFEEAASRWNLDLDAGESQLCAVVIKRALALVVTGDKRAIEALEALIGDATSPVLDVAGKMFSLEQFMMWLIDNNHCDDIRDRVCADQAADRTMTICCGCSSPTCGLQDIRAGLDSYVSALRTAAPQVLNKYPEP